MKRLAITGIFVLMLGLPGMAAAQLVDFEDLVLGTTYVVGDSIPTGGIEIKAEPFQWSSGGWTSGGFAQVGNSGMAGGAGKEMVINNINLVFFPGGWGYATIDYGEHGGNLNIEINGDFVNFEDFIDIDGKTIGGVVVAVVDYGAPGHCAGRLYLTGPINTFSIGGQEFAIDNVVLQAEGCFIGSVM